MVVEAAGTVAKAEVAVDLGEVEVVSDHTVVVVALAVVAGPCERAVDGLRQVEAAIAHTVEVEMAMVVHMEEVTAYDVVVGVP